MHANHTGILARPQFETFGKTIARAVVVFMAALMLCMCPRLAYAATYVTDGTADKLAAIIEFLGYDPNEGTNTNQLQHAFMNALNNASPYSGFDRFRLFYDSVYSLNNSPQPYEQYWSTADGFQYADLLDGARSDASEIYKLWLLNSGTGTGGGSSGGDIGETGNLINFQSYKTVWYVTQTYWTGIWYDGSVGSSVDVDNPIVVKVPKDQMDYIRTQFGNNFRVCVRGAVNQAESYEGGGTLQQYFSLAVYDTGATYALAGTNPDFANPYFDRGYNVTYNKRSLCPYGRELIDGVIDYTGASFASPSTNDTDYNQLFVWWSDVHYPSGGGGTTTDPVVPPTSDPVEPAPTEPTYETNITFNVIDLTINQYAEINEDQYTADLTGVVNVLKSIRRWVFNIYNLLITFSNKFSAFVNQPFTSLLNNVKIIAQNQLLFYQHVNDLFEHTWYVLTHLQTGSTTEFDDNNIITWLQMIYQRLLQWPSTRPSPDDPLGLGALLEWLANIIGKFFDALLGLSQADLTGLLQGVEGLTSKFPFSIPWDIGAVFALFAAPPVTPHVEYPLYSVGMEGAEHVTDVVVDLSDYDAYMAIVRGVELALFTAGLAWRTRDVMDLLGIAGGDS